MMETRNILWIGADFDLYSRVKDLLREYELVFAVHLSDGLRQFNLRPYDLIIIDLQLVNADRAELLQALRRAHPVPIIAVSEDREDEDVARVLNSGADAHLSKPVSAVRLEAQARALIRRYTINFKDRSIADDGLLLRRGDFSIDYAHHCISQNGRLLKLSAREYELLCYFIQNANCILTEDQIYDGAWKVDKDYHSGLYTPISRLRQKIEPDPQNPVYLLTVRGMGYYFRPYRVESCDTC